MSKIQLQETLLYNKKNTYKEYQERPVGLSKTEHN